MKLRVTMTSLLALTAAACTTTPHTDITPGIAPVQAAPSSDALTGLVDEVRIPYETFTLDNGLTVVVHEDRKAPVVAVSVWYDVGSKHEPRGKTGFAHLFEHLMFNGSENAPGDFFEPLRQIGATDLNGTTNPDRTNYFQTVPTGALETALFLESDRMGHLLGAVTQEKLDNQRGVVQNEKRQGDNAPYGLLRYEIFENLFPKGHPYHHSTIGSMADLNAARMTDVQSWFRNHYGPNNAVLVLAGDIDVATARPLVQKWFGDIARGPKVQHPQIGVPTLPADKDKVTTDQISTTRLYRMWAVPGMHSEEGNALALGAGVLGGLASSRLDEALVRRDPVAVSVASFYFQLEDAGVFGVQADVKPGEDEAAVAAKLDAEIQRYISQGPTADELQRAKTSAIAGTIRGLESVGGFGGKAVTLAEGELYFDNPGRYREDLEQLAQTSPDEVRTSLQKWLTRPVFRLTMRPGARTEGGENRGGAVTGAPDMDTLTSAFACGKPVCDEGGIAGVTLQQADRSQLPPVGELKALDFPDIERATLSNGMEVYFARRDAVPTVSMRVAFDAGYTADPRDALGTQSLMLQVMDEGTTQLDATQLAIAKERLGVNLGGYADLDTTNFGLDALSSNLAPSIELLAQYIRSPAFGAPELERVRAQQLNRLNSELKEPNSIAARALAPLIYGEHPYGIPPSGLGEPAVVQRLTRDDLSKAHATWLRPDRARIFVVGDTTLPEVTRLLERSFGDWKAPATPAPVKRFDAAVPAAKPRIVLIDRPNSPQSVIYAGRALDLRGTDDLDFLNAANESLGGGFLSRINMNLRETKGWSYGSRSGVQQPLDRTAFFVAAPVQADRTGDSIRELRKEVKDFLSTRGISDAELTRTVNGRVRELPGQFETSGDVLAGMYNIVSRGRPDNYYEQLASRYRGATRQQLDQAARSAIKGDDLVFVVVGDAKVVRPQLKGLGLPVEERPAS